MSASRKVLLVGWDAADWKVIHPLMDAGKMPNVQRLVDEGVSGQIHAATTPMLWTSIATGKRPFKHGIHGFSERRRMASAYSPSPTSRAGARRCGTFSTRTLWPRSASFG
jgi:predicted AlkP superfamily phosphohydrolase/phosphomutase